MRKTQKKKAQDFLNLLEQAHEQIKKDVESHRMDMALNLLAQCQEGAIELGNLIEREEGEGCTAIPLFQTYCELVYEIYENLGRGERLSGKWIYKNLRKSLIQIENTIQYDIPLQKEAVFLPYKASMWDSMESVWMAVAQDPQWEAYVIPIPYYERNKDGGFGSRHYEGESFPEYVSVIPYDQYNFAERRPDVIYIHNPYDQSNYVTSVDPSYYSGQLKKYTECLVYIPYYTTTGAMSKVQSLCLSYFYVDYIVVQSEAIIDFFDSRVPRKKFLPFGSPKFDRVARICQNPPPIPEQWRNKAEGKRVCFYNTSLGGMLADTDAFMKKMEYVFQCFQKAKDTCLLWRPHPLLEATFESMRSCYYNRFMKLKKKFIDSNLGIYDDTPDITKTIALCDAYVGDPGTSVTALFGIAGKPMFILDNHIWSEPGKDDWRMQIVKGFQVVGDNQWLITQGNKLYHSPGNDYRYEYYCDLSPYSHGGYYLRVFQVKDRIYVCPKNAQEILMVGDKKVRRRILLEYHLNSRGAFAAAWNIGRYLFLIPDQYPVIVRYDTENNKIDYIDGYQEIYVGYADGQRRLGGSCVWKNYILLSSPVNSQIFAIDGETKETQVLDTGARRCQGYLGMITDRENVWMSPFSGTTLTCWNPETGELWEYSHVPEKFICKSRPNGCECLDYPYDTAAFCGNKVFLSPRWGNMFLCLDKATGEMSQWKPPFWTDEQGENGGSSSWKNGYFIHRPDSLNDGIYDFFSYTDARLYRIDLNTGQYEKMEAEFDLDSVRRQEPGFTEDSEWLPYCCRENCFNTLERFLDGDVAGSPFNRDRQIKAYEKIAANLDGTCGEKIHRFMDSKK